MAVIIPNFASSTEDRASNAQIIDGSLSFDSSKSQYLTRTSSNAGNRTTWTWSAWVRRNETGQFHEMFGAYKASDDYFAIRFEDSSGGDYITTFDRPTSGNVGQLTTSAKYRDLSAWYHIVYVWDTTNGTAADRRRLYVNGTRITSFTTDSTPSSGAESRVNAGSLYPFYIGKYGGSSSLDAELYMTQTYFIDGQALGPEYFGYTDPLTNTWRPKKYTNTTSTALPITTAPSLLNGALIVRATDASIAGTIVSGGGNLNYLDSSDGINWTHRSAGTSYTFSGAKYLAAGGSGTSNRTFTPSPSESYEYLVWNTNDNFDTGSNTTTDVTGSTFTASSSSIYGLNGFYLPLDGNTPIGQDRSGRGNNWTPVNFGGSAALDKATGALPILNTANGGNVATTGTRDDISPSTPTAVQGAVKFDGSGDYLSVAHSADFDLTNGDFTLEGYFNHAHTSGYVTGCGVWREASGADFWSYDLRMTQSGTVPAFLWTTNGTSVSGTLSATTSTGDSRWHHIAVTRSGTSLRIFVDGNLEGSTTTSDTFNTASSQPFVCGWRGTTYYNGFMSNVRLIKGTALYTSNFTPPAEPLTAVTNTKLLCCQSSTSAGAAAASPNISGVNDGTAWSSYMSTSGSLQVANSFPLAFDGSTSTNVRMNTGNGTMTYRGPSFTVSSQLRMYLYQGNGGTGSVSVNGVDQGVSFAAEQWYTIGSFTGTVDTFTITASANAGTQLYAVEVDGVILVDPVTVNGDANATRSESSGSNVLALPLVGNKEDVSNLVSGRGSAKTITNNNSVTFSSAYGNFYGASGYFGGSSYLSTDLTSFNMDSDFTIEFWWYKTGTQTNNHGHFLGGVLGGTNSYGPTWRDGGSDFQVTWKNTTSPSILSISNGVVLNEWHHYAFVYTKSDNSLRAYVDGILKQTTTSLFSSNPGSWGSSSEIGRGGPGWSTQYVVGYVQDYRIYQGAKYTQNFIPASTDPDILPDTPSGVAYSSKLTKITDGAVSFDGSGDYLTFTSGSDLQFGSGDFTVEMYVYPNTLSNYDPIIDNGSIAGNNQHDWRLYLGSVGEIWFDAKVGGSDATRNGASGGVSNGVATRKWQHIAVTRSGNTIYTFLNGVQVLSNSFSSTIDSNYTTAYIGADNMVNGTMYYFDGFISNLRVLKGTALYTSNFTPPTRALTSVANTKLLCCKSNSLAGAATSSPNISGINDGTVWSEQGSFVGIDHATYNEPGALFTSGTGTSVVERVLSSDTSGSYILYLPPYDISYSSSFSLYLRNGDTDNSTFSYSINGGANYINLTTSGAGSWVDISGSGTITSTNGIRVKHITTAGTNAVDWRGIKIDSVQLLDPVSPFGNASASTLNPFNTDINTVRGQETGYAVLNPLTTNSAALSRKNLRVVFSSNATRNESTIAVSSGKWYWEGYAEANMTTSFIGGRFALCVTSSKSDPESVEFNLDWHATSGLTRRVNGSSTVVASGTNYTDGDHLAIALDADNSIAYFYKNNILSYTYDFSSYVTPQSKPLAAHAWGFFSSTWVYNFGQKPFKFTPPPGFQPLALANTARPNIVRPDQYVGISTWTGNGGTQSINVGWKPDFVWIKERGGTNYHMLFDTVRGANVRLNSNSTNTDYTETTALTSFDSAGFSMGGNIQTNGNTQTYVGWSWKAGGNKNTFNVDDVGYASAAAAGLTAGTITPTGASVGTKQGFSIIKYNGNATSGATVPHGLSQTPDLVIVKQTSGTNESWRVRHSSVDPTKTLYLNQTVGETSNTEYISGATSSTFTLSTGLAGVNASQGYIAYCWHSVPGYSKFGSFTANANTNGPFVYLGFRPALVVCKKSSGSSGGAGTWFVLDSKRDPKNVTTNFIEWNNENPEASTQNRLDFVSNGFKVRAPSGYTPNETSGDTYIYAAWAEAPAFNLFGGQSNAR